MTNKKVKTLSTSYRNLLNDCDWINKYCSNGTCSIKGLRQCYNWTDALIIICGNTYYNVTNKPNIYYELAL